MEFSSSTSSLSKRSSSSRRSSSSSSSSSSSKRYYSYNYLTMSLSFLIVSAGVVSMAVVAKLSAPLVSEFLVHLDVVVVPPFWNSLRSWLTPPCLYVVIHVIILVILLSSRLSSPPPPPPPPRQVAYPEDHRHLYHHHHRGSSYVTQPMEEEPRGIDDHVASRYVEKVIHVDRVDERPSSNFSNGHRRAVSCILEGNGANTLDSTWRMITENRSNARLKKSETWERSSRRNQHDYWGPQPLKRSEPLNEADLSCLPLTWREDSGKIWREPSLSQDELNRRAEAFIQKVKEEMRLQRQESLDQYLKSINGVTD
ncbi:hypothetical protein Scep_028504 [Stephania cephalantha]|uniref:DUF4408 domain-containing protein n=1 Tax=Stephania cephalantha TaxID=152367 RepID=A0AAP0EDA2_9MAGN